jgi:hypothetical protein
LLTWTTAVGAETLWERITEFPEPSVFKSLGVFGTPSECQAKAWSAAQAAYSRHLRGQYRDAEMEPIPGGWRVKAPVEFAMQVLLYQCFPDTVDPREPKGTK